VENKVLRTKQKLKQWIDLINNRPRHV
jgi:hypothetical protein